VFFYVTCLDQDLFLLLLLRLLLFFSISPFLKKGTRCKILKALKRVGRRKAIVDDKSYSLMFL